ncbi:hypothetical protein ACFVY4_22040 [Streptomyces sp. NPDC058299]|uniref:hypothetical protein n=1 Tax=Streptomyces sp. NPDC058299 TaxID=3346435 RepID=UPI0036F0CD3D
MGVLSAAVHCRRPLAFRLTPGQAGDAPASERVMSRVLGHRVPLPESNRLT